MSAIITAKVIPPSTLFGELLRRSRFAAYDPAILQTYSAPPLIPSAKIWVLKVPLSAAASRVYWPPTIRRYIEWNRADHQVKVVKAVEEMNTAPGIVPQLHGSLDSSK
ncbi:hypothetical protein CVT25_012033 [Psilocybe cyanescens]|uniref:Uncharacterized protein n=1 Tax=Psilocybe cyanescens TaxID=93625 RepID=A0A409XV28_PSICY|nr:hypothetical protein CVT25_012033 [Psilocybe cyanescens]